MPMKGGERGHTLNQGFSNVGICQTHLTLVKEVGPRVCLRLNNPQFPRGSDSNAPKFQYRHHHRSSSHRVLGAVFCVCWGIGVGDEWLWGLEGEGIGSKVM